MPVTIRRGTLIFFVAPDSSLKKVPQTRAQEVPLLWQLASFHSSCGVGHPSKYLLNILFVPASGFSSFVRSFVRSFVLSFVR